MTDISGPAPLNRAFGWTGASPPDPRDFKFSRSAVDAATLPETVDLSEGGLFGEVWDQGNLGACTAFGSGKAYVYDLAKADQSQPDFRGSTLFQYYNTRILEDTVNEDSGASIVNAIKALKKWGFPPESDWSYDISKFTQKPTDTAYTAGELRQAVQYVSVRQDENEMKAVLAAGTPIVIGFHVYSPFMAKGVAETGVVSMPQFGDELIGGHCVIVVGYVFRGSTLYWKCLNSWSAGWGDGGYFYMPIKYLTSPQWAEDFWTVQSVESGLPLPPSPPKPPSEGWFQLSPAMAARINKAANKAGLKPDTYVDLHFQKYFRSRIAQWAAHVSRGG